MRKITITYRLAAAVEYIEVDSWFIKEGNLQIKHHNGAVSVIPLNRLLRFDVSSDGLDKENIQCS